MNLRKFREGAKNMFQQIKAIIVAVVTALTVLSFVSSPANAIDNKVNQQILAWAEALKSGNVETDLRRISEAVDYPARLTIQALGARIALELQTKSWEKISTAVIWEALDAIGEIATEHDFDLMSEIAKGLGHALQKYPTLMGDIKDKLIETTMAVRDSDREKLPLIPSRFPKYVKHVIPAGAVALAGQVAVVESAETNPDLVFEKGLKKIEEMKKFLEASVVDQPE